MSKFGNATEYANHRGVSAVAVSKALKTGRIKAARIDGNRKVLNFDECDRLWELNKDPSNRGYQKPVKIEVTEVLPVGETHVEAEEVKPKPRPKRGPDISKMTFNEARTRREQFQSELARIDFEEKSGILVKAEDVKAEAFKAARTARDTLLNFPDRLAPMLVGRSDIHEVRNILLQEIHLVCRGLGA